MLEFKDIYVSVNNGLFAAKRKEILSGISFSLQDGDTLGIVGESGSGKSTIANVIFGLVKCSSGKVMIDKRYAQNEYSRLELAKNVQMVMQNPETSFDSDLSIYKSFIEVLKIHKLLAKDVVPDDIIRPLLVDIGLEDADLNKLPRHFSGGELQRLSIVRALLVTPKTIIFDEADSMLDTTIRIKLFQIINEIKEKYGLSIIYITHDIRVLTHLVKNVLIIRSGKMVEYGPVDLLKTSKEPFVKMLRDSISLKNNE